MPYTIYPRDRKPLRHELFDKFLVPTGKGSTTFKASETLYAWQERNHPWLELTEVHRETTENIRVTVIPFYVRAPMDSFCSASNLNESNLFLAFRWAVDKRRVRQYIGGDTAFAWKIWVSCVFSCVNDTGVSSPYRVLWKQCEVAELLDKSPY